MAPFKQELNTYDKLAGNVLSLYIVLFISQNVLSLLKITCEFEQYMSFIFAWFFWIYLFFNQRVIGNTWKKILLVSTIVFFLYVISSAWNNNFSAFLLKKMLWTFVYCIPLGCIWYDVKSLNGALSMVDRATIYVSGMCFFYLVADYLGFSILSPSEYSMGLGYAAFIAFMYHIMRLNKNYLYIVCCCIDFLVILLKGSRGPILWAVIFFLLLIMLRQKVVYNLASKFAVFLGLVIGSCVIFFKDIIRFIVDLLAAFDIHSRTLNLIAGKSFHLSGRDLVWQGALERIQDRVITGCGLSYVDINPGPYPHNIVLEIILQYGVIVGGILLLILLLLIVNSLLKSSMEDAEIILLFFSVGFLPLLLSGTYSMWPTFWLFVGICLRYKFTFIQY